MGGRTSAARSRASLVFDAAVVLLGAVAFVVVGITLLGSSSTIQLRYLLAVPAIVVMGFFPMLIGRTGGGIEVGLDFSVLAFLVTIMPNPGEALIIWFAGTVVCQLLTDKRGATKAFNTGLGMIAGTAAVLVVQLTRGSTETDVQELLAMGLGAAVYFSVDFFVSAISLSLEERTSLRRELAPTGALAAFVAFLAISSLGYLGALVVRSVEGWPGFLLVVPVVTILFASHTQSRGAEHARRLKGLLDAAVQVQTVRDQAELLEVLRAGASDLLRDPRVELRSDPPSQHEIGAAVQGGDQDLWIVGPALNRARSSANDDQRGLTALVAVAEDAFTRLRLTDAMTHLAWHDPLTGLANRSLFMDRTEHAIARLSRRGGALAVLFCDLDGFKRVNDLFGHAAGDELLVEVSRRVVASVRRSDTVARLGGDEFAVLLEDLHDADEEVALTCRRILEALRSGIHVAGEDVSVTTTIGVAKSQTGQSADAMLSQADLAMYYAKSQGKNRFEVYQVGFGDERRQRIELVETLRRAIEAKDLAVVYQPVVDLRSREVHGVEALVRWRRDGALVPPDLFIPTAEDSGLIVALGSVVLDIVVADMPMLRAAAGHELSVGVNISAQQLHSDGFVGTVLAAKARMGDVNLVLEVTERDFVNNYSQALATISTLADADVRFAIDDFGVGFSSISYLQQLPVRILKVDKCFLDTIDSNPRSCALVRSVVVMGEALGLDVVIEGIERESQLTHLVEHAGAVLGQGYLLGHPVSRDELAEMLAEEEQPRARRAALRALS